MSHAATTWHNKGINALIIINWLYLFRMFTTCSRSYLRTVLLMSSGEVQINLFIFLFFVIYLIRLQNPPVPSLVTRFKFLLNLSWTVLQCLFTNNGGSFGMMFIMLILSKMMFFLKLPEASSGEHDHKETWLREHEHLANTLNKHSHYLSITLTLRGHCINTSKKLNGIIKII